MSTKDKPLIVVESPAKARTISRFLGNGYMVESSIGHVRDLPATASEIPASHKDKDWSRLGVNVGNNFEPIYIVPPAKKKQITKLKHLLAQASALYLATDEDREGESIAWHLCEVLKPKIPVKRMVFHEITESAIKEAIENPRDIDLMRVNAQEARRILDRLYGYEISPVLWRRLKPRLSAGRVQSVAVRMIVERERERMLFIPSSYWGIEARLVKLDDDPESLQTRLVALGDKKVAIGRDFEPASGSLMDPDAVIALTEASATALADALQGRRFTVESLTEKPFIQRPYPPFITSTLQQECSRKLRFSAQHTMRIAQGLYENGYITYMRTDSTHLSSQAVRASRKQIAELFGADYLPDRPRVYAKQVKGAQEAHEAIRPAGDRIRKPADLEDDLDRDAFRLYELIWKRTLASQMKDAKGLRTSVRLSVPAEQYGRAWFAASGKVISFDGFLRVYVEDRDDPESGKDDQERILPALARGEQLNGEELAARGHTTKPPPRFTEASLVRELETRGIGRPSTYASIIQTILDRGYVWKKGPALVPTITAFAVIRLLERYFAALVNYDFTARMENDLDEIASGDRASRPWLSRFYFGTSDGKAPAEQGVEVIGLKPMIGAMEQAINAREVASIEIGKDEEGRMVVARLGRYGPYLDIGDGAQRATLPDHTPPDELSVELALEICRSSAAPDRILGEDAETGKPIYLKKGRYGPYVQLGDPEEGGKGKKKIKPKMAGVWPTIDPDSMTMDDARMLLSYPKVLGKHPGTGETITAQDGRYGPYIKMGSETRALECHDQLKHITLDAALVLLSQPRKRKTRKPSVLKDLGHADPSGVPIRIMTGRYGPYVTDGDVNASIPKGRDPATVTQREAMDMLAARRTKLASAANTTRKRMSTRRKKAASGH